MKLALMDGDTLAPDELRNEGFEAIQMFFGGGAEGDDKDPDIDAIDAKLEAADVALAAMTLHVDLVGPRGCRQEDVDRIIRCIEKTAGLDGRFGDNEKPLLIWHPSAYPESPDVADAAVFAGLCEALQAACRAAEANTVNIGVEITRAGSIGSAETFLRVKDRVRSEALQVCLDAANFVPDRTPLERAVRLLGPDVVISHGKDSSFAANGEVAQYGPIGSGKLDYPEYIRCLQAYAAPAYFVLEYYKTREDLLKARDIVLECRKPE